MGRGRQREEREKIHKWVGYTHTDVEVHDPTPNLIRESVVVTRAVVPPTESTPRNGRA